MQMLNYDSLNDDALILFKTAEYNCIGLAVSQIKHL